MTGILALEVDGKIYSTDLSTAQALNSQFVSVFSARDSASIPDKGPSPYQDIQDLDIGVEGVKRQLTHLKINKAGGPDDMPPRILHDYAEELAIMLTAIMKQSYDTNTLPEDWRKARVTWIYKKGKK